MSCALMAWSAPVSGLSPRMRRQAAEISNRRKVWSCVRRGARGMRRPAADALLRAAARAAAALPETHLLCEARARLRVVRRHHRIVARQAPLLAIFLGAQIVMRAQVPLQRFEFL